MVEKPWLIIQPGFFLALLLLFIHADLYPKMKKWLLAFCLIFNFNLIPYAFAEDESPENPQSPTRQLTIKLDTDTQKSSGIETLTLEATHHNTEFTAHGKVINLQPLLALRNRYLQTLTEQSSAKARFKQSEQSFIRQEDLYLHGASSKRSFQEQQALWEANKAQAEATDFQGKAVIDETRLLWGKELSDWALSSHSNKLNPFLTNKKKLIQITLPSNKHLPETIKTLFIEASGDRSKAHKAEFISPATQTETVAQGESYYFQVEGKNMLTGMNLTAWIPEQVEQRNGVIIPKSALLWHLDQAFVYLQVNEDSFMRRTLATYTPVADGYFVPDAIKPGEQIVTKGAQMLLSEELKNQIPTEDDD